jgi:hypothetical protein
MAAKLSREVAPATYITGHVGRPRSLAEKIGEDMDFLRTMATELGGEATNEVAKRALSAGIAAGCARLQDAEQHRSWARGVHVFTMDVQPSGYFPHLPGI